MKFLFLHSDAQRRRRNGMKQPHRLFLEDGTEIKGITSVEVRDYSHLHLTTMTITLAQVKVTQISRRPVKVKK